MENEHDTHDHNTDKAGIWNAKMIAATMNDGVRCGISIESRLSQFVYDVILLLSHSFVPLHVSPIQAHN
jgi:hypothetical protein